MLKISILRKVIIPTLFSLLFCFLVPVPSASQELNGYDIMKKVDERPIPVDMKSESVMRLIDKRGKERVRTIRNFRYGDDKQILWFLKPADVKGSSFLKHEHDDRDDDMWLYLPAFGKVRRIASHAKKGSFMGSDFTYEDMGDRKLHEYTYELLEEVNIDEKQCWVVQSVPNEGVVTDYSKIISWVWKEGEAPVKEEFYDKRGKLKKVKSADFQKVDKYWVISSMTMENLKSRHSTEIAISDIQVDTGLKESVFDTRYMKRIQ